MEASHLSAGQVEEPRFSAHQALGWGSSFLIWDEANAAYQIIRNIRTEVRLFRLLKEE